MSRFNQMAEALKGIKINAEDLQDTLPRPDENPQTARSDDTMQQDRPAERDNDETVTSDVRGVQKLRKHAPEPTLIDEPSIPLVPNVDVYITRPHTVSFRMGARVFGYKMTRMPIPAGLIVGECPGKSTDPRLPMFPYPVGSSAANLLAYSGLSPIEYLGLTMRTNLCPTTWFDEIAVMRVQHLKIALVNYIHPIRVLLLGAKVQHAWSIKSREKFGQCTIYWDGCGIRVAWAPHPSGLNRLYNDHEHQREAGRYVRWCAGLEDKL